MIIKRRPLPDAPDYKAACRQTISLYNVFKIGSVSHYHRTIFDRCAFLDVQRLWREQTTGTTANTNSLLVIPIGAGGFESVPPKVFDELTERDGFWTIRNNDKAYPGIGPEVLPSNVSTGGVKWTELTDTNYPGTITVKQVNPKKTLDGVLVHIEAGGQHERNQPSPNIRTGQGNSSACGPSQVRL